MAARAQHRHPAVDRVSADEARAAARAALTSASVHGELLDEAAPCSPGVPIIAKARPARGNRFTKNIHDCRTQRCGFVSGDILRRARRVDSRAKQCLVRVDVADASYRTLIHEELLDRLSRSPKKER